MANINQGIPFSEFMKQIFVGRKNNIPKFSFNLFVILILFTFASDLHALTRILARDWNFLCGSIYSNIKVPTPLQP